MALNRKRNNFVAFNFIDTNISYLKEKVKIIFHIWSDSSSTYPTEPVILHIFEFLTHFNSSREHLHNFEKVPFSGWKLYSHLINTIACLVVWNFLTNIYINASDKLLISSSSLICWFCEALDEIFIIICSFEWFEEKYPWGGGGWQFSGNWIFSKFEFQSLIIWLIDVCSWRLANRSFSYSLPHLMF